MTITQAIRYYLKSKTNIGVVALCGAALVLGLALTDGLFVPGVSVLSYIVISTAMVFSRRGAREIVAGRQQAQIETGLEKLEEAGRVRDRLRYLRLPDGDVKRALDYFLIASGKLLEVAASSRWYHPDIPESLENVAALMDGYLKALDEQSTQRRYGQDGEDITGLHDRIIGALQNNATRFDELRRIELPSASDMDSLLEMEEDNPS